MSVGALVGCLAIPGLPLKPLFVAERQAHSIVGCVQGWLRQKRKSEGEKTTIRDYTAPGDTTSTTT